MSKTSAPKRKFENAKKRWQRLPRSVRRPIVLIAGVLVIIAAALTGPLPGPGGIPLFLIGIAILATEFDWAKQVRDWVIDTVKWCGHHFRKHKIIGTLLIVILAATAVTSSFLAFRHFRK